MVQIVTGNLVEVSSAVRIEIFNGVNLQGCKRYDEERHIEEITEFNKSAIVFLEENKINTAEQI
jgi:hypothetical protein